MKPDQKAKINLFSIFFLIAFVASPILFTFTVSAQDLPNPINSTTFEGLVKSIADWLYVVSIPLAVIIILYVAFLFMTSGGEEEKIKKAKRSLLWALVGIGIIIIGAGFITLIKDILGAK